MMTEEQSRFEQWAAGIYDTRLLKDEKGNYRGQVLQQLRQAWQAALTQPASPALKLPDGWVAVPREATREMIESGWTYHLITKDPSAKGIWACMIAAAPNAPHTAPIEPICATGGAEWVKPVPRELKQVLLELRTYNPKADEHGGKHIIPGWADRIEKALGIKPSAQEEA